MKGILSSLLIILSQQIFSQFSITEEIVRDLRWRNIGPANMMCRIASVDALHDDYRHVLVGSASGGVFKSSNAGMTWEPIFDDYGSGSIGVVRFNQKHPSIIWVGTGESANRNSSSYGDGIYKSSDGGKTFTNMGLESTHQIADIAVHPTDSQTVFAAAIGHLWGYSGDRGLYRTKDGGKTWSKLTNGLPNDGKTGCTDIIMHPNDPNTLFASFYHRIRSASTMYSGGSNGGIFKSTDGGESWTKVSQGLPTGETGMIDISICTSQPNIMVAAVEADEKLNKQKGTSGSGVYKSTDGGKSWKFIHAHAMRPFYHGQIKIDPIDPNRIYIVSRAFQYSDDGGETFKRGKPWGWKGAGDDHDLWVCNNDSKIMYQATDQGAYLSVDGKHILAMNNMAIGQYYKIGVDMRDPYWVMGGLQDNGLWIGPSNSRERRGILNRYNTHVAEGDGFASQIDPTDWNTLYTVNHVGFACRNNLTTREFDYITPTPESVSNFEDYVDRDYNDKPIKYTIDPGEHWFHYERKDRPTLPAQFRFNWNSPLIISPHDHKTLFFAGNHLFKSTDRGDSWEIISPDLTRNNEDLRNPSYQGGLTRSVTGGENHFTIFTISQSPVDANVIWVGSDDGLVHVTQDGGKNWQSVRPEMQGLHPDTYVAKVEASHHQAGVAYIAFDNHRNDDNKPYVFQTKDFGKSWKNISSDLPAKYHVNCVLEDPENENLLFAGTESGVYASLNQGGNWIELSNNMPTVAAYDMVIHPRDGDLVVGTHGRSIWILDNLYPLRQMSGAMSDIHIFKQRTSTNWAMKFEGREQPDFAFRGENPPRAAMIDVYSKDSVNNVKLKISSESGLYQDEMKIDLLPGINRIYWRKRMSPPQKDIDDLKSLLSNLCQQLQKHPEITKEQKKHLKSIGKKLKLAKSPEKLNELRLEIIKNFNMYGNGRPMFGEKLLPVTAPEGKYLIDLKAGDKSYKGEINIRKDPMLTR